MSAISIKQLLEAGVHFGHQTSRWHPKMKDYIFGERNGIHIIDLQQTLRLFGQAVNFVSDAGAAGKEILFVGTKRQAQEAVEEDAVRCGMHFVTNRWLGGLLTNFQTVQNSIKRYKQLQSMAAEGFYEKLSKKEVSKLERERKKLDKNLRGIQRMTKLPDVVFIIDAEKEAIAVKEAKKLGIPVVAVVDTDCDPDVVDFVIPGNDDALRSVKLFTSTIADSLLAGRTVWEAKLEEERLVREEADKKEAEAKAAREAARQRRVAQLEAEKAKAAADAKAKAAEAVKAKAAAAAAKKEAAAQSAADASVEEAAVAEAGEPDEEEAAEASKSSAKKASGPRKAVPAPKAKAAKPKAKKAEPAMEEAKPESSEKAAEAAADDSAAEGEEAKAE